MFVGAETVIGVGFDAARAGLASLVRGGWLADASGRALRTWAGGWPGWCRSGSRRR
jgi:hypothetical protein